MFRILTTTIFCLLVASCGGGGGSASSTSTTYSGVYFDAPTKGLSYTASPSGLTGTTGSDGSFSFQAGDTVTFKIATQSGTYISVGSVTPATPSSSSTTATTHVLSLENGTAIARVLQSLDSGSTSGVIDVSSVSSNSAISSTVASSINTFISSNSAIADSNATSVVTVSERTAIGVAVDNIANLSNTTLPSSISTFVSGSTYALSGVKKYYPNGGVIYSGSGFGILNFTSGNKYYSLCVYYPITSPSSSTGYFSTGNCSTSIGINEIGTWTASSTSNNTMTVIDNSNNTSWDVVSPLMDERFGMYTSTKTTDSTNYERGVYTKLYSSLTVSTLANKAFTIYGDSDCTTDGKMIYTFNSSGTSYTKACSSSTTASFSASGSSSNVSTTPGVIKFVDANGGIYYVGITSTSSISSGTAMVTTTGNSSCSKNSLSNCGSMRMVTFTSN